MTTKVIRHASSTRHAAQPEPPARLVDVDQDMAQIEKGQQLAGHFPNSEALERARDVLLGQRSIDDAFAELEAKYRDA